MTTIEGNTVPQYDFNEPENILVLSPDSAPETDDTCTHLLQPTTSDHQSVLCLTIGQSPDDRIASWRKHSKHTTWTNIGFVPIGDKARSAVAATPVIDSGQHYQMKPVSDPTNLTDIGIRITNFLTDWATDDSQLVVCMHTLTEFLNHVDIKKAYQFLNVLTYQLQTENTISHFHFDPTSHEERTLNLLKSIFDTVLEPTSATEWTITR